MTDPNPLPLPLPLALALVDRSVSVRGSPKRPVVPVLGLSDKAQQRLIRQAIVQAELDREDRDALRVTHEEMRILRDSVKSVKAEFSDLDGLSWDTPQARDILAQWHAEQLAPSTHPAPIRRSHSPSVVPPPSHSLALTSAGAPHLTPPADDRTPIRLSLDSDSRRSSASTIVPDREDAPTPTPTPALPTTRHDHNARPPIPKSHSAPHIGHIHNPFADAANARPTRPLPPSRIPVRSKSLSAKPSAPEPAAVPTARRHASAATRHRGPRTIHLPRPLPQPSARRTHAPPAGLSASPGRRHPAHTSKFRIVSAPAPGDGGVAPLQDPLVRVRGVGVCRVVVEPERGHAIRRDERAGKRARDEVDDRERARADGMASPSRAGGTVRGLAGGVPMRRT